MVGNFKVSILGFGDKSLAQPSFLRSKIDIRACNVVSLVESMNIDDILAEAGGDAIIQKSQDLQALSRAWVSERSAPEILPWPDSLMERVLERIHQQVNFQAQNEPPLNNG